MIMDELKYEILYDEPEIILGRKLFRIVAKKTFFAGRPAGDSTRGSNFGTAVRNGETGGFVEGEWNLSQDGSCWIGKGAAVFGRAKISENALVHGIEKYARPSVTVRDNAKIHGNCEIKDHAQVRDFAEVGGCSVIRQYARIEDRAVVIDSDIGGYACLFDCIYVKGSDKLIDFNARPARISSTDALEQALRSVEEAREDELPSGVKTVKIA